MLEAGHHSLHAKVALLQNALYSDVILQLDQDLHSHQGLDHADERPLGRSPLSLHHLIRKLENQQALLVGPAD